jgi:predicted Zn-dependent peptidase
VLYRAGVIHEEEDKALLSMVSARMLFYSGSPSFEANEAVERIRNVGRMNVETVGDFTHYDYIIPPDYLDFALQVEAERFAQRTFTNDLLKISVEKCSEDIDYILDNPFGSLVKYGLIAFNQAFNYKKTNLSIYAGGNNLTTTDVKKYQETFYRPDEMVVALIGDFNTEEAKALVTKRLGPIQAKPAPTIDRKPVTGLHEVTWDINADVVFFGFPGPYDGVKERLTLTMFGAFLNYHFTNDAAANEKFKTVYVSNRAYPVRDLPFFIFVQPRTGMLMDDIRAAILLPVQNIIAGFNETFFDAMKSSTTDYLESSVLASQFNVSGVPHHQLIGQGAMNIGMKHLLKEGLDDLAFTALLDSISFDDARQILEKRFVKENMGEILIKSRSK